MMNINEEIKEILLLINHAGYEAYMVGGAIRDYLLNIDNKDYDLCTNMPLEEIKKIIPNLKIMKENNHRNTGIININGNNIEISVFKGKTLEEDLLNRDFTINSIAIDKDNNIIDLYNGREDISNKKISLIKPNGEAFLQDPLRILRAIRLSVNYNFNIDQNCKDQMLINANLLSQVAPERIYDEFKKILLSENVSLAIKDNKEIIFQIIPELKKCDGFEQHNDYHIYNVFDHTLEVIRNTESNIYLRLAALFHDIGKPQVFTLDENNVGHFFGHAKISREIFRKFADKYKIDNKTKNIVLKLITYHIDQLSLKKNKIYNFLKKYGTENIDLLFELKIADTKGKNPKYLYRIKEIEETNEKYREIIRVMDNINFNGYEVTKLGFNGKIVAAILDDIMRMVVNNQIENSENVIKEYIVKKYIEK